PLDAPVMTTVSPRRTEPLSLSGFRGNAHAVVIRELAPHPPRHHERRERNEGEDEADETRLLVPGAESDEEPDDEEHDDGEVDPHGREARPLSDGAGLDRREVHESEDGSDNGAEDADADEPHRSAREDLGVVAHHGGDVENGARDPHPDGDGHEDRVEG